ncbi:hypothetical protein KA405_04645 [Patescibacteria group bacterium]|nr:hypothetical protein [Patescibacteria group bacterium]
MLRFTLFSLVAQLIFMNFNAIPPSLVRPLFITIVVLCLGGVYLYATGNFTEEKLVEKIAEKRDEPMADLHAPKPEPSMHLKKPQ